MERGEVEWREVICKDAVTALDLSKVSKASYYLGGSY